MTGLAKKIVSAIPYIRHPNLVYSAIVGLLIFLFGNIHAISGNKGLGIILIMISIPYLVINTYLFRASMTYAGTKSERAFEQQVKELTAPDVDPAPSEEEHPDAEN